jgi:hypothetical protein
MTNDGSPSAVTLDLKGCQYQGRIYPGPTALVLSAAKSKSKDDNDSMLKVDGITDEFCHLVKIGNGIDMLTAVTHGRVNDLFDKDDDQDHKPIASSINTAATRKRGGDGTKGAVNSTRECTLSIPIAQSRKKRMTKSGIAAKS